MLPEPATTKTHTSPITRFPLLDVEASPTRARIRLKDEAWRIVGTTITELLQSYSAILFVQSRLVGMMVLLISFLDFEMAASGILSWLTAIILGRYTGAKKEDPARFLYTFNALLVGLSIGFLFKTTPLSLLLLLSASALTVMVSHALFWLLKSLKLPVLNLPFVIVSMTFYLASTRYDSLFPNSFQHLESLNFHQIPAPVQGFLRSLGFLIFMPFDFCGILLIVALFLFSRIAFFAAVLSYFVGTLTLALLTDSQTAYLNLYAYNFILTGIALGGVFLIPSKRSYLFACLGAFLAVFILNAVSVVFNTLAIPVFTLPFNIVVLLFVYVLTQRGTPEISLSSKELPEASLANHLNFVRRFDPLIPKPLLPFSGRWTVYQGFDGQWTHRGVWKYAYDFIIQDDKGMSCSSPGDTLEDYYCYGKPVFSPVSGTVIDANDSFRDNPIGEIDTSRPWGNFVILYCPLGYYIEISHLKQRSLKVKTGDFVQIGEVLAACGNSGYSSQPHLHIQVQYGPELGSETSRFYFSNCLDESRTLVESRPLETGMAVEPFTYSYKLSRALSFIVGDCFSYEFHINGREVGRLRIRVETAGRGSRHFAIEGTEDKIFFGLEDNRFAFYSLEGKRNSPLELFFAALPKVPICSEGEVRWSEPLPDNILFHGSSLSGFFRSFHHGARNVTGNYRFLHEDEVVGEISNGSQFARTRIVFDEVKGFRQVFVETTDNTYTLTMV